MQAKHARKVKKAVTEEEDEMPEDIHAFRNALARRIHRIIGDRRRAWTACPEQMCRRAHACQAPKGRCAQSKPPRRPATEREQARNMAQLRRQLEERMAQIEAERVQQQQEQEREKEQGQAAAKRQSRKKARAT